MRRSIFTIVLIALSVAILAVSSQLSLAFGPIPFTLQTLSVGLIAAILRPRETLFSILLYLILGFFGFPIFSGGAAGAGVLFGATGGYLLAFIFSALLISLSFQKWGTSSFRLNFVLLFLSLLLAFALNLLIGTLFMSATQGLSLKSAFIVGFLPFIWLEFIKAILVFILARLLKFPLSKINSYFRQI